MKAAIEDVYRDMPALKKYTLKYLEESWKEWSKAKSLVLDATVKKKKKKVNNRKSLGMCA